MKTRIITAVVALAIFIPLIVYGSWPLTIAAVALGMIAMGEILSMKKMFLTSFPAIVSYIGVAIMVLPNSWLGFLPSHITRLFAMYVMVLLLLLHTVVHKQRFSFDDAGVLALGMLYIGIGFNNFLAARAVGFTTLLYAMLIVWLTDSGAICLAASWASTSWHRALVRINLGRLNLRHAFGHGVLAVYLYFFPVGYHNWGLMVFLTLLLSILGQFGDLVESALKRFYGVKDSGKILPGHGGILDRFDSMLLVMPALYLLGII